MKSFHKILFRLVFFCSFGIIAQNSFAQDSSRLRISLLTCTPSDELYSTFGHTALRVVDSNSVTDVVYNYGTFEFTEGFYMKFIRGKLRYSLSIEEFHDFLFDYRMENRGVTEQVLNFSPEEKELVRHSLNENAKEENRYYMYDFFLDNCTTRVRDLIVKYAHPIPQLPPVMPVNFTFRNAIHQYLDSNHKDWSKLGIDLLLGAPTDAVMTTAQQQFLPDNLMIALDKTTNNKIVQPRESLYSAAPADNKASWFTPLILFTLILIFYFLLSLLKANFFIRLVNTMDAFLFFITGLLGILLVFMWVATDHSMTKNNYNILWAWPVHFIYALFINRDSKKVRTYSALTAIFLILLLCCWHFLAQDLNNALIPLVLLLIYRSGSKAVKRKTTTHGKQEY